VWCSLATQHHNANPFLSVIIPVFNEESIVAHSVAEITTYLEALHSPFEVIVVDDGSSDNTRQVLLSLMAYYSKLDVVFCERNMGKGYAVKTGMLNARGKLRLFTDCDLSTPISELPKFIEKAKLYDIVIGSRALKESVIQLKQPLYRRLLGVVANYSIRLILGLRLHDTQCGFKIFTEEACSLFRLQMLDGFGFDFELLYLATRKGYSVHELPVLWADSRTSNVRLADYFGTFLDLMRVRLHNYKSDQEGKCD
jgi:dolichyl-phosphate beta-glucosyltransferase